MEKIYEDLLADVHPGHRWQYRQLLMSLRAALRAEDFKDAEALIADFEIAMRTLPRTNSAMLKRADIMDRIARTVRKNGIWLG